MSSTMATLPMVALGNVLIPVDRGETPIAGKTYRTVGVKWWGEGVYEREPIDGSQTQYSILRRIEAGDIIINKIWARHGSVAVVQSSLSGCYASTEFPTWTAASDRLDPRWVHWLSKTEAFWNQCDEKSRGTSGKNRIRPEKFLEISIPLPSLDEQRRIVARIEELAARIEAARGLRREAMREAKGLVDAACNSVVGQLSPSWKPLRSVVESIENGHSPACEPRSADDDEWGVLKVGAVSFGAFNANENKVLSPTYLPDIRYEVRQGDFLMCRANTRELVGACAIVRRTRPRLMLSDKIFRFVFNSRASINPEYLDQVLKSSALRQQIERQATGTSPTMKNISKEKVLALLIPAHSSGEQQRIVDYLTDLRGLIGVATQMQAHTAAELDALLPSVLDKAFRGEL